MEKKGIEKELIAWIIAVLVLIFAIMLIMLLNKQGITIINKIKEFLRFGR
jgi:hypothetical protein